MEITDQCGILRPLRCELNILSKPDGSAILSQGETVVFATVYGPGDVKPQKLRSDKTAVETICMPKSGLSFVGDRQCEAFLRNTCDSAISTALYPRTGVTITVQEVQNFGGLLACSVNAVCLALINSGIEMKFLIAGVSCMVDENGDIVVDPDDKQLTCCVGKMTFVFENTGYKVVASHTDGVISQVQYQQGLLKCKQASEILFNYFRSTVQRYTSDL